MFDRLPNVIWVALFWCVVVGIGFETNRASYQQSPPHNREQPTKTKDQNAELSRPIADPATNENSGERKQKGNWYDTFREHPAEWLIAIFNGLLVYVTYRLVTTTGDLRESTDRLWDAGERQLELIAANAAEQSRDMKASILAAETSAKAAMDQVRLTRDAMIHTQRAFVFVKEITEFPAMVKVHEKIVAWRLSFRWGNSGETPTKHMLYHVNFRNFDNPLPEDFAFEDIPSPKGNIPVILGPKASTWFGNAVVPIDILKKISDKTTHFYIWGWTDYNDVFEGTDRHRTEFCYKMEFTGEPFPEGISMTYQLHDKYNGADDECMKKPRPYARPT